MTKILKNGYFILTGLLIFLIVTGCTQTTDSGTKKVTGAEVKEVMIDVNKFSKITSTELIEIMGEPQEIQDYKWSVPSTGQSIVGKLYIYEENKYEFILFDDSVARLNIYSGKYWGYDDSVIEFENERHILDMFNIEPNKQFKKTGDNNFSLRYSPVSDTVEDLWIQEIEDKHFGVAKITYNSKYY